MMLNEKKVLIIIPAYNESENIEHVVRHMMEEAPQYDYLVVNDGSTDNTLYLCRKANFHYLDLSINMGNRPEPYRQVMSMHIRIIMILQSKWMVTDSTTLHIWMSC